MPWVHLAQAMGQRGAKRQALGGSMGEEISPVRGWISRYFLKLGTGIAESSALV